ncbi:MAG: hypothetical protein ABI990_09525 [Actinomycetota bacterium]
MTSDAWPSTDSPPAPLPRLEDLPIAERGYDQEAVRVAFDSFYRHAAQLDASLRGLEAVEVFRRDADALRNDLRALRALGLGGGGAEPAWARQSYERATPEVPGVVLRLAAEAALLVAVAVVAGVAQFRGWVIVAAMTSAFLVVAVSEWFAARARFVPPAVAFLPLDDAGEPAPYVEAPAPAWGQPALEPVEDTEPDALTMIEQAPADEAPATDPWEHAPPVEDDASADDEPEDVELAERGGIFRRRRR